MSGRGVEAPEEEDAPSTSGQRQDGITFVLENASLETANVGKVQAKCILHDVMHAHCMCTVQPECAAPPAAAASQAHVQPMRDFLPADVSTAEQR